MKKILAALAAVALLSGCGGGNGGGSSGGVTGPLTHNELAAAFVRELNATGLYDVTLAKSSTEQYNYVVIYDWDLDEYDAVSLAGYQVGQDPVTFLENRTTVYYDLIFYPGYSYTYIDSFGYTQVGYEPDLYEDYWTGLVFEKVQSNSKDLEKFGALAEERVIDNRAEAVAEKFGLSLPRGKEVVRLAMAWKKKGGKDLSEKDQDAFATNILGFSISEAKAAATEKLAGNSKPLDALVQTAINTNEGMNPERANELMKEYFGL